MPQTQQQQPPDTLPANFFDTQPSDTGPPPGAQVPATQQAQPPPDTLPADFFDKTDDPRFSTASLGPNFQPDYETTVYAKPLPPDAPPGFWGSIWKHVQNSTMAPFDIAIPGVYRGAAQSSHLLGNAMDVLDKTEGVLADLTRSQRVNWFRKASDWFHAQGAGAQQTAQQWSAGNQSFPAELGRSIVQGATQLPTLALATAAGGLTAPALLGELGPSMVGFGGLGALESEDKGPAATFTGGAAGALTGGLFHIAGQTGLPLRVPLSAWLGYLGARIGGASPSESLANGASMGLFSALPGAGGAGVKDITRNITEPIADKFFPVSPEKSAAAQQVMNLARKYEIPLTAGDISQEPLLKNAEISLEKVPLQGVQKLRQVQEARAKAAAQGIQSQYEEKLLDTDQSSLEELEAAAAAGDQRARNVQEKMIEAGNDPARIIQASIGLGDWTTRQTANNLYDRVQNLAEEHNLGDVPMDSTVKAINSSLQQLRPAKLPNKEVMRLLGDIKNSIIPETDEKGNVTNKPDNSYGLIRQLHSDLGDRIREYYEGNNALIGEKGVGHLERTQNAIEDDMRNYAQNSNVPEIVEAGRQADSYYKTARVPYKNGMLASAAVSNEPDQIFQQFIKAGKGDRAQQFYNALDDKGRAAVRYNMVEKAVEDSINPQSGIFSPQKFFTSVDKLDKAYGVFFKPKDLAEIRGFQNLMGHITRAGQYAENPPTGQRVIPFLIAGAAGTAAKMARAHPVGAAASAALFGAMRGLFTTTRGRNLLLRAYGIKPGTSPMESTWQDVGREMPRVSGKPPEESPEEPPR